jgi:hypothetical protein
VFFKLCLVAERKRKRREEKKITEKAKILLVVRLLLRNERTFGFEKGKDS